MSSANDPALPIVQEFLTPKEAAAFLRLGPDALARHRVQGTGPVYYGGPGKRCKILYRKTDLIAWVEQFRRTSTSDAGGGR